jgi:hypothetical protein
VAAPRDRERGLELGADERVAGVTGGVQMGGLPAPPPPRCVGGEAGRLLARARWPAGQPLAQLQPWSLAPVMCAR